MIITTDKFKFNIILFLLFFITLNIHNLAAQLPSSISATGSLDFTSSNLPIIIIDTFGQYIHDEYRIIARMKIIYNGEGKRNYLLDSPDDYDGRIAIELRGSASLAYPKKGYRLETQDSVGNNLNVSLVGLPKENDWILYGPYDDQSLIRNVLAYKLSNDMGRYASRTRFCELVLNNDYRGIYVLMEKIKRDKNRVKISRMDSADTGGDDVTGGYIIKIDKEKGENVDGWTSAFDVRYQYHYPKANKIIPAQKDYIRDFMNQFENTMTGPNLADSIDGYPKYIDVASFVDHFILCEFCKNIDAYRISNYMYKDRDSKGGKLNEGPIWDYNLSFGKTWYPEDAYRVDEWEIDHNHYKPNDWPKVPFWWERLGHDAEFARRVKKRWRELRTGILQLDSVYHTIDLLADTLAEARVRNFQRWPETGRNHLYIVEIDKMKLWIRNRVEWIEANLNRLSAVKQTPSSENKPQEFALEQNYPNPFNALTTIRYHIPEDSRVKLCIYNIFGQEIMNLVDENQGAGFYQVQWDGKDGFGRSMASGVYIFQLVSGEFGTKNKMLLIK